MSVATPPTKQCYSAERPKIQVSYESYKSGGQERFYLVFSSKNQPKEDCPSSLDDIWVQKEEGGELKALWIGGPNWRIAPLRSKHPILVDRVIINDGRNYKWMSMSALRSRASRGKPPKGKSTVNLILFPFSDVTHSREVRDISGRP